MSSQIEVVAAKLDSLNQRFEERMDILEVNVKEHIVSSYNLLSEKIKHVDESTDKAHERLDRHTVSIQCLKNWKHRIIGGLILLAAILTYFTLTWK